MSLSRPRISIQDYVSSLPDEVQCFQFRQYYLCLFGHVFHDKFMQILHLWESRRFYP